MSLLPEGWWTTALDMGVSLLLWAIFKVNSIYSYFKKRGIPYVKPVFPFGSDIKGTLGRDGIGVIFDRMYKALNGEKIGGFFLVTIPITMICDHEYINKVLATNFEDFHDRPFLIDEEACPLEAHLFYLRGNKWKFLRSRLSPVFTTGKIKYMYEEMSKCSDILIEYVGKVADGRDVDMYETLAKFATDVIGSTAFGLEPECLKNPDSKFRAMGKQFFKLNLWKTLYIFIRFAAPRLVVALKLKAIDEDVSDYFMSLYRDVFEYRKKNGVVRKDFIQLAMELKDLGHIVVDAAELKDELSTTYDNEKGKEKYEITDQLLAAQSFVFYLAGFETVSTTFYFLIYMLATHGDIQDRAREEVRSVKRKYGSLSYEAIMELTFMDKCINETLRLFPPLPFLNRECMKDFTLPNGMKIEKGAHVTIPLLSIHRDPRYFPDPEEFRPDRFDNPPLPGSFIPFGAGPRMCVGKRFGMVELKMAMAKLLDLYRFDDSPLAIKPIQFSNSSMLHPLNPLWVNISKCQD